MKLRYYKTRSVQEYLSRSVKACRSTIYELKWEISNYWTCGKQECFSKVHMGNSGGYC